MTETTDHSNVEVRRFSEVLLKGEEDSVDFQQIRYSYGSKMIAGIFHAILFFSDQTLQVSSPLPTPVAVQVIPKGVCSQGRLGT